MSSKHIAALIFAGCALSSCASQTRVHDVRHAASTSTSPEVATDDEGSDPITEEVLAVVARPITLADGDWRAAYLDRRALRTLAGRASYYHDSLAGNSTASGEPYDPHAFTAANRTLPFGTILRVVRLDNGASTIVRVNDRGPFGRRRRLLDLSRAAAEELDMIDRGVSQVRVEILERGAPSRSRRARR